MIRALCLFLVGLIVLSANRLCAEDLLKDVNGDGTISYLGFGDSITYGVGDGVQPGQSTSVSAAPRTNGTAGYVARIGKWLGIPVRNEGDPGESLTKGGVYRLPTVLRSTNADIIGFMEGTNDFYGTVSLSLYEMDLQRAVNSIRGLGKQPVLMTLPQTCCSRIHERPRLSVAGDIIRRVAVVNDIPMADVERAWWNSCGLNAGCELLCSPEGLHPNSRGYDVIAQVVAATLLGIDIFAADGAENLEQALGWAPGSVIVKPDPEVGA